jgi:hypothetical protein
MDGATCPYCQKPYKEEDGSCAECKALFPWAIEAKAIREDIKSREVNRGRATFTLIDELFTQGKGGKPVSAAALKGFAFAWLFPRTLIVIGSAITGAVLIAQTAIIYKQTQLLEGQTDLMQKQTAAAQLEQAEKLRVRIAANMALLSRIRELNDVRFSHGGSGPEVKNTEANNDLEPLLKKRIAGMTPLIPAPSPRIDGLNSALNFIEKAMEQYQSRPSPTGLNAIGAVEEAQVRCAASPKAIEELRAAFLYLEPFKQFRERETYKLGDEAVRELFMHIVEAGRAYVPNTTGSDVDIDTLSFSGKLYLHVRYMETDLHATFRAAAAACQRKIEADNNTVTDLEAKAAS